MKLGIDFGTCFSFPAATRGNAIESLLINESIYIDGIPSVFYYDKTQGEKVGVEAEAERKIRPSKGVKYIKREMRGNQDMARVRYTLDNKDFGAKDIIIRIIRHVIELAKKMAPNISISPNLENIVIAVPAMSGSEAYRRVMLDAAIAASGLSPSRVKLVDEPVAAAMSYLSQRENIDKGTILTYDLGGGTFDSAIVTYDSKAPSSKFTTIVQSGNTGVGGTDWDEILKEYFLRQMEGKRGEKIRLNEVDTSRFEEKIIEIKHKLSRENHVRESFFTEDSYTYILSITREEFEKLTKHLLDMTISVVKDLAVNYSKKTGKAESSIETIVLVGGASKMPQVIERLRGEFPNKEVLINQPDRAIAFGAALYAEKHLLLSVAPKTYGVECNNRQLSKLMINNILFRDSQMVNNNGEIYVSARRNYSPLREEQNELVFMVYESDSYEGIDWEDQEDKKPLFKVAVPVAQIPGKKQTERLFSAEFRLLQDGILELRIIDKDRNIDVGFDKITIDKL